MTNREKYIGILRNQHVDALWNIFVIKDTPQWLHETLSDLYAYYPDADMCAYGFQSDSVTCQNITLTEVLSLISQDLS